MIILKTKLFLFFLFCIPVPPSEPNIYDENENNLTEGHTRPYEEGATMTLMCVSRGGK